MSNNLNKQQTGPKLVLVNSDNFKDCLMTEEAYRELTLQMSTGDYHMHKHVSFVASYKDLDTFVLSEPVYDLINFVDEEEGNAELEIREICSFGEWLEVYATKPRKAKQKATIYKFDLSKQKERTPRERLERNQRMLFGYIAPVVNLDSYRKSNKKRA